MVGDATKLYVSWEDINELVFKLYKELKDKDIDKVVGISRGGLIPGVMLCLLYTSPSPRDKRQSRMPSSA